MPANNQSPLIIGHRGASAVAPENTLAAFSRALEDGANGIELDVRLARDGLPVVIHDATLKRTGGETRAVSEMSSTELARTDVGSWFNRAHPQLARLEYSKEFVPTLEQVFAILKTSKVKDPIAYVELKIEKRQEYRGLVESVAALISDHKLQKQIIVVGFNLKALALIRELDSSIRTGALFEPRRQAYRVVRRNPMITAALTCGANEILLHRLLATSKAITDALKEQLVPVVWAVEDSKWISRAGHLGVYAVIANDPSQSRSCARAPNQMY